MNTMIMSFGPFTRETMKCMRAVESDSVKSARKAQDKLHKACERASENREQPLHRLEQHRMCMASIVSCPD